MLLLLLADAGAVVSVATPPPQHFWSTEMNVVPPDVDADALGCTRGGTKPAWLLCVSGAGIAGTPPNSRNVCSMFRRVVGVRVGVVRVGTPQWSPPSREFNTKLVMVGVSRTGTSVVFVILPKASTSVATAVIVKLTLGIGTSLLLLLLVTGISMVVVLPLVHPLVGIVLSTLESEEPPLSCVGVRGVVDWARVNIVRKTRGGLVSLG